MRYLFPYKPILYLSTVAFIAVTQIYFFINFVPAQESKNLFWAECFFLVFALFNFGHTLPTRISALLTAGVLYILIIGLAAFVSPWPPILASYFFIVTFILTFFTQKHPSLVFISFTINLSVIVAGLFFKLNQQWLSFNDLKYMLLGLTLAALLQFLLWSIAFNKELKIAIFNLLQHFKKLNTCIFACLLETSYPDNLYLFENRLRKQKNDVEQALSELHLLLNKRLAKRKHHLYNQYFTLNHKLVFIYQTMMDYSQLRRRVNDHATFTLCEIELTALQREINDCFLQLMQSPGFGNTPIDTASLSEKIVRFEENYQTVLTVSAREPMVFLYFIFSIKILCREFKFLFTTEVVERKFIE